MNESPGIRVPLLVLTAIGVNAILFGVIQYMVVNRQMQLSDASNFDVANFIRMQEQSRDVRSRRDPKAPEKPDTETQQDLTRLASVSKGGSIGGLSVNIPNVNIGIDTGGSIQIARELTPLVRFPADYPERARAKAIEGWVNMRFTVTETGGVADPEVIAAEPEGVFERSAIRAVLRWKFQPQLVDGKPVPVMTYTRLVFVMEPED